MTLQLHVLPLMASRQAAHYQPQQTKGHQMCKLELCQRILYEDGALRYVSFCNTTGADCPTREATFSNTVANQLDIV